MKELAAEITAASGTEVVHQDLTPAELVAALRGAGLDDLPRLLGRPATSLRDAVRAAL